MFCIAFDLVVAETLKHHPKRVAQAYSEIRDVLLGFGFDWRQGSLYTTDKDDLANLFAASVRDIRAFKIEHWSDFTALVKSP